MAIDVIIGSDSKIGYEIAVKSPNESLFFRRAASSDNLSMFKSVDKVLASEAVLDYTTKEGIATSNRRIVDQINYYSLGQSPLRIYFLCGVEEPPLSELRPIHDGVGSDCLQINFASFVDLMSRLRPHMSPGDSVCVLSSVHGVRVATENPIYGATKAAINHYVKCLAARELRHLTPGEKFIRYNSVCPEGIDTPMIQRVFNNKESEIAQYANSRPMKRLLTPAEVAEVMINLNESSGLTGQVVVVGNSI